MNFPFHPKLLTCLREGYGWKQLLKDSQAGLLVGLMAVPLAIGFGIASIPIVPPAGYPNPAAMGLYTAIIAGFLISAFGGSKVQIGGPTGAFIPVVSAIVLQHGLAGLWTATFLAGIILIILGAIRAGIFSKFIPLPVVIGFTSGIAVIIASQQAKDFLGIHLSAAPPAEFLEKMKVLWEASGTMDWHTAVIATACVVALFSIPHKYSPRILVMVLGTVAVFLLGWQQTPHEVGIATIGSTFGKISGDKFIEGIPSGLPSLFMIDLSFQQLRNVLPSACVIAFLGALESILSALATDKVIKDHHDSDQELIAQGIANCIMPWFGGLPVTGAIARSSVNVQSGGRSPVAGIIHALFLACVLLFAGPLISLVPLCVLAAIMIHVSVKMFEFHGFLQLRKITKSELAMAIVTFLLTVVFDLTYGVVFGLVTGAIMLILRLKEVTVMRAVEPASDPAMGRDSIRGREIPREILIYRIEGAFFYAVADDLPDRLVIDLDKRPEVRVVILRIGKMLSMDYHGLTVLQDTLSLLRQRGIQMIICDAQPHPTAMMHQGDFLDHLTFDNLCGDMDGALKRAQVLLRVPAGALL